ncbi:MAG: thioredoxin family protein [Sphingobacteriaceae bacterium]|nr:thioredoxin family protein [Sphingobacteriaceae bacterium]
MKIKFLFFLSLFCSLTSFAGIKFDDIRWKEAKKKAKLEDKLIFMDFYTTWCGPCKRMDADVLSTDTVGNYFNSRFINLKLDAEKGQGVMLASTFSVKSYPSYIFANSDGEVVDVFIGGRALKSFLARAQALEDKEILLPNLEGRYNAGERSVQFLTTYFSRLKDANRDISKQLKAHWEAQNDSARLSQDAWKIIRQFATDVDDAQFKYVINHQPEFTNRYGTKAVSTYLANAYALTLFNSYRYKQASKFQRVKRELEDSEYDFADRVLQQAEKYR